MAGAGAEMPDGGHRCDRTDIGAFRAQAREGKAAANGVALAAQGEGQIAVALVGQEIQAAEPIGADHAGREQFLELF